MGKAFQGIFKVLAFAGGGWAALLGTGGLGAGGMLLADQRPWDIRGSPTRSLPFLPHGGNEGSFPGQVAKGAGVRPASFDQKTLKLKADFKYPPRGWTKIRLSVGTHPDPEPPTRRTALHPLRPWAAEPEGLFSFLSKSLFTP